MQTPFIGPGYNLDSRPASVQRTINLIPVPLEPGNERAPWVLKDVPGLVDFYEAAPPPSAEIGWSATIGSSGGPFAHANTGTGGFKPAGQMYAAVVGWTSETVVWSIASWESPTGDTTPTVTDIGSGTVLVDWPGSSFGASKGVLTLTATVDGTPIADGQRLVAAAVAEPYNGSAWGPEDSDGDDVDFIPAQRSGTFLVRFLNMTPYAGMTWAWDFGDGNTSTAQNPQNSYASAGTYTVSLVATGPGGGTETKPVVVV